MLNYNSRAYLLLAADLIANAAGLTAVVNNPAHNSVSNSAVTENPNTVAENLVIIAGRTFLVVDLQNIKAHLNHSPISDVLK